MMRTQFLEAQLRQGRLDGKTLDSMIRRGSSWDTIPNSEKLSMVSPNYVSHNLLHS